MREQSPNRIKQFLANYPLTFYFGLLALAGAGLLAWLHYRYSWEIDLRQFWVWAGSNAEILLIVVTALLGVTFLASAIAYRQTCKMSQEDYYLWLHQRATRTLFPIFTPLHDWLRLRFSIYRWWHSQLYSTSLHVLFLIVIVLVSFSGVRSTFSPLPTSPDCSVSEDEGMGDILISSNTTWSTDQCVGDLTINNNATLTLNGGITVTANLVSVGDESTNGHIVFKGDTLNGVGVLMTVAGNVTVRSGSTITGNGGGYAGGTSGTVNGSGPGGGTGTNDPATSGAGGGGYGGAGGSVGGLSGGSSYGSATAPDHLGSGGGYKSANGGAGGAAIKIVSSGTFTINGSIKADGSGGGPGPAQTGGSGGTVWIEANSFAGTGVVTANGGDGTGGNGGGGGGRILRKYTTAIGTGLTLTSAAGSGGVGAQAGTIQNIGPVVSFGLTKSSPANTTTAGAPFSLTISALATGGTTYTAYTGTISFSSNDPQATLPSSYTFRPGDNGVKAISGFALKTAGLKTITVTEVGNTTVSGSSVLTVSPAAAESVSLNDSDFKIIAGAPITPIVTFRDAYSNIASSFTGSLVFSTTDPSATLPSNSGVATYQGTVPFSNGVVFRQAGGHVFSLSATSAGSGPTKLLTTETKIYVSPAAAAVFELSWPAKAVTAGQQLSPTLRVRDAYSNIATDYTGTVRFGSNDSTAVLPTDYTFVPNNNGAVKAFPNGVILKTAGQRTVTVTEVGGVGIQTSGTLTVSPAAHAAFRVSATSPQKVGVGWVETVTPVDAYGNTVSTVSKAAAAATVTITGPAKLYRDANYVELLGETVTNRYQVLYLKASAPGTVMLTIQGSDDATIAGISASIAVLAATAETARPTPSNEQPVTPTVNQPTTVIQQIQQAIGRSAAAVQTSLQENKQTVQAVSVAAAAIAPVATVAALGPLSTAIITAIVNTMVKGASFFGARVGVLPMNLRGRRWGRVSNRRTKLPIGGVFVDLLNDSGQVIERILTDKTGHYAFLVDRPGRYWVQVSNPLYERFLSRPLTITNPTEDIVNEDIDLTLVENRLEVRLVIASVLLRLIDVLTLLHWPLLVLGSALSLYVYALDPSLIKALIVSLYVLLWATKLLELDYHRPYGVVVDAKTGTPQPFSVVQIVNADQKGTATVRSTMTDGRGRFLFVIKPGKYLLTVGKEGYRPYEMEIQGQAVDLTIKLQKEK